MKKTKRDVLKEQLLDAVINNRPDTVRQILQECPELIWDDYKMPKESKYLKVFISLEDGKAGSMKIIKGTEDISPKQGICFSVNSYVDVDSKFKLMNLCGLPCYKETADVLMEFGEPVDHSTKYKSPFIKCDITDYDNYNTALSSLLINLSEMFYMSNLRSDKSENTTIAPEILKKYFETFPKYYSYLLSKGADPFVLVLPRTDYRNTEYIRAVNYTTPFEILRAVLPSISTFTKIHSNRYAYAVIDPYYTKVIEEMLHEAINTKEKDSTEYQGYFGTEQYTYFDHYDQLNTYAETEKKASNPLETIFEGIINEIWGIRDTPERKWGVKDEDVNVLDVMFNVLDHYAEKVGPEEVKRCICKYDWRSKANCVTLFNNLMVTDSDKDEMRQTQMYYWTKVEDFITKYIPLEKEPNNSFICRALTSSSLGAGVKLEYYADKGADLKIHDLEGNNLWHCLGVYYASNLIDNYNKALFWTVTSEERKSTIISESYNVINTLYKYFPDGINSRNFKGDTPLHIICKSFMALYKKRAKERYSKEFWEVMFTTFNNIITYMTAHGADITIKNEDGIEPIKIIDPKIRKILDHYLTVQKTIVTDIETFER